MIPQRIEYDAPLRSAPVTGGGGGRQSRQPRGPAEVVPFPLTARVVFVDRTAEIAASYRDPRKYLANVYRQQEEALRRRGFDDAIVQSEMAALERAVQSRMDAVS